MKWKRTELPQFAEHCRRLCARYGVDYEAFDLVRDAIEENLEDDPIEGTVEVVLGVPELRRFLFERYPPHWDLPPLVVILEIHDEEHAFTLLEVWSEEELEEQA